VVFDSRLLGGVSVLAAVVETGNFVRAAEALGLTQSGISRAVARLEARVGVRLLDRTPRAVSLTDECRRFHAQVAPLLAGRRPFQLDQLGVSVPAPDRHGGDAKLFQHLRIGDKRVVAGRVVGLEEGGVGGHGVAPFLERGTTPINRIQKFVGLAPGTIFAPVFG
jgi:DNA-binding MarR family transcriptional regulator